MSFTNAEVLRMTELALQKHNIVAGGSVISGVGTTIADKEIVIQEACRESLRQVTGNPLYILQYKDDVWKVRILSVEISRNILIATTNGDTSDIGVTSRPISSYEIV